MNELFCRTKENPWLRRTLLLIGCLFVSYVFFRDQVASDFRAAFSDMYDGVIADSIVSHWYAVFQGKQVWNQIPYFYPYPDTLGYNDGYLLHGVFAAFFRLFGIDFIRSADLALIFIKLVGYFSMFGLLQSMRRGTLVNVLVATLFSVTLLSGNANGHMQLVTVAFSPLLAWIGVTVYNARNDAKKNQFLGFSISFAILFAAWMLTAFYTAFFFTLFVIFYIITYAGLDWTAWRTEAIQFLKNWRSLIVFFVVLAVALCPFILVYLPKVKETGGQSMSSAMLFMQTPSDIFNFGQHRLVWEWSYPYWNKAFEFRGGEQVTGFLPVFFIVFVICGIFSVRNFVANKTGRAIAAVFISTLVLLLFSMKFGGFSLWKAIYYAVPGAKGVRVISRFWIFLAFPMCIVIASQLKVTRTKGMVAAVLLLGFLIAEQIDRYTFTGLDINKEFKLVVDTPPPPKECHAFYGVNAAPYPELLPTQDNALNLVYRVNVQSMAIAVHLGLPTINGNSTFNPPDWNFSEAPSDTYIQRVTTYVKAHNLSNVCQYDISNKIWSPMPRAD